MTNVNWTQIFQPRSFSLFPPRQTFLNRWSSLSINQKHFNFFFFFSFFFFCRLLLPFLHFFFFFFLFVATQSTATAFQLFFLLIFVHWRRHSIHFQYLHLLKCLRFTWKSLMSLITKELNHFNIIGFNAILSVNFIVDWCRLWHLAVAVQTTLNFLIWHSNQKNEFQRP